MSQSSLAANASAYNFSVTGTLASNVVKTDVIEEETSGSGVTIDGLLIKDGTISGLDMTFPPNYITCTYSAKTVDGSDNVLDSFSLDDSAGGDISRTSSSVITINTSGVYSFQLNGFWGVAGGTGNGIVELYRNSPIPTGVARKAAVLSTTGGTLADGGISAIVYATAGSTFSFRLTETSTGTVAYDGALKTMSVVRVA